MTAPSASARLSSARAGRHVAISLQVKRLVQEHCPACTVYVATYTTGRPGRFYQPIEEQSGAEFWSVKAWSDPPRTGLKDPDVLVVHQGRVHFAVEVKWGAVPGSRRTDVRVGDREWARVTGLFDGPARCRVRGPAVQAGRRLRSAQFAFEHEYPLDDETRLVLVTDVAQMQCVLGPACWKALQRWRQAGPRILLADVNTRVGDVPALRELLTG